MVRFTPFFFFFQAEDGIRDLTVTGVQTCALPILLFFAFLISIVTGVLFGLAPAVQAANPNQLENLREGSRGSGVGRRHTRLSHILVVSEVEIGRAHV